MNTAVGHGLRLLVAAGAALAIATGAVAVLEHAFGVANASAVYLVAVVFVAWLLIPAIVGGMLSINRQYAASNSHLALHGDYIVPVPNRQERAIVPVPTLNRAVVRALNVARSIPDDVSAVFISEDPEQSADMRTRWDRHVPGVPLVIVESPYRALAGPLMAYLDVLDRAWPPDKTEPITFVVIPEYVARHWWERILYNQSAKRLRSILLGRPHTVVVDVPYRRDDSPEEVDLTEPAAS